MAVNNMTPGLLQEATKVWISLGAQMLPQNECSDALLQPWASVPMDELRTLYQFTGGMKEPDEGLFRLWPLAEVAELSQWNNRHGESYLWFADCSMNAHAFCLTDNGAGAVFTNYVKDKRPLEKVAESVSEFIKLAITRPQLVHLHFYASLGN